MEVSKGGYPWRVVPAVPPGGVYPVGYSEADTVLTLPTHKALMTAIVSHFAANRNRRIREIFGQTADFEDGADLECVNIQITNRLSLQHWISQLPSWAVGTHTPRIQVVRARTVQPGGPPDTPAGEFRYIDPRLTHDSLGLQ